MDIAVLGQRIKSLRFTLGKSQKEFAEFLGIPQPSMSAYENGKNSPTIDVVWILLISVMFLLIGCVEETKRSK